MTKREKEKVMDYASYDINIAKDRMDQAAEKLSEKGLLKDAETLMRMVYRLEMFQTKYNEYRL